MNGLQAFLKKSPDKILLVNGARQIGKSYIIRYVCVELFPNYVEIDLRADKSLWAALSAPKCILWILRNSCGRWEREKLAAGESLDESAHEYIMKQLKYYLLVGGLPEAVDLFAQSCNLFNVRTVQKDIHDLYGIDASKYDKERKLKIINSGISLDVTAISNPKFPLKESKSKNLVKLYLNDVGILTSILYGMNANAVINDEKCINLGTVSTLMSFTNPVT